MIQNMAEVSLKDAKLHRQMSNEIDGYTEESLNVATVVEKTTFD